MTSSTSSSDQLDRPQDTGQRAWRRWLLVFCGAFFGVSGLLYGLLLLVDPYDVGRFPSFGITGHADRSLRTADASRGRDPNYNAAVIGNSTGQIINPFRLSEETGLKFAQLSIPATGPREQLVLMRWVMSHHPSYGAFVIVADPLWCSPNPDLPLENPFPFWLYGGDLDYLANVLSSKALDRVVWRIAIAMGLMQPVDPVGYTDYLEGRTVAYVPDPPGTPPDARDLRWPQTFPWILRLRAFLAEIPSDIAVVLAMPPIYVSGLPTPGSELAQAIAACKQAMAETVAGRPRSGFLDFRVDTPAVRDPANFADSVHYRWALAHDMEDRIIAVLRGGPTAWSPMQAKVQSASSHSTE